MATSVPPGLTALGRFLLQRPLSLRAVSNLLECGSDYEVFKSLVWEVFPDQAAAILSEPEGLDRIVKFLELVNQNCFPISEMWLDYWREEPGSDVANIWKEFTGSGIPFILHGISWMELHELWERYMAGWAVLALLPVTPGSPYWPDDREDDDEEAGDDAAGLRLVWMDEARALIPQETLLRIPAGGVPLEQLARALRGTRFESAAWAGAWFHQETGLAFLDTSHDEYLDNGGHDNWDADVVRYAARDWVQSEPILMGISHLAGWLEEDLPARFAELLEFTLARLEAVQGPLASAVSHGFLNGLFVRPFEPPLDTGE